MTIRPRRAKYGVAETPSFKRASAGRQPPSSSQLIAQVVRKTRRSREQMSHAAFTLRGNHVTAHVFAPRSSPHISAESTTLRGGRKATRGRRVCRCCISRSSLFACIAHSLRQLVAPLCFVICVASGFFPLHHYAVHICTRAQETAPHAPSESATAQRTVSSAKGATRAASLLHCCKALREVERRAASFPRHKCSSHFPSFPEGVHAHPASAAAVPRAP